MLLSLSLFSLSISNRTKSIMWTLWTLLFCFTTDIYSKPDLVYKNTQIHLSLFQYSAIFDRFLTVIHWHSCISPLLRSTSCGWTSSESSSVWSSESSLIASRHYHEMNSHHTGLNFLKSVPEPDTCSLQTFLPITQGVPVRQKQTWYDFNIQYDPVIRIPFSHSNNLT